MNGAQSLFKALTSAGLDTCFANPGTSEMQLVYEIGMTDTVRPVLCLQENVVTGAADGYARMAGKPAFTLLHVGSGFANGIANLHNAGRANSPVLNIVGANATYHQPNFPEHECIGGSIQDLARVVSHWTQQARSASELGLLGAIAARQTRAGSGKICTLVAPTNCHWEEATEAPQLDIPIATPRVASTTVAQAARMLANGKRTALLLGGHALREPSLELAGRIAGASGARLMGETFPVRLARGEGRVEVQLVPYFLEIAMAVFAEFEQVILVGALNPVSTFAYRDRPTGKLPPGCEMLTLATADHDIHAALADLVAALGTGGDASVVSARASRAEPPPPAGELTPAAIGRSICLSMPENAILVDESGTAGPAIYPETVGARAHDYLYAVNGGSIGNGLPISLGAAIACPDRKVVTLQADGSAMYTNQALWTMAREGCDVTIVLLRNDAYAVLDIELARVRSQAPTPKMLSMFRLDEPGIDWVKLAGSMGVKAVHVDTAEDFHREFAQAMAERGPRLIEVALVQDLQPVVDFITAGQAG